MFGPGDDTPWGTGSAAVDCPPTLVVIRSIFYPIPVEVSMAYPWGYLLRSVGSVHHADLEESRDQHRRTSKASS